MLFFFNQLFYIELTLSYLKLSRLGEATLLGISTSVLDKLRTKVRKTMEQGQMP